MGRFLNSIAILAVFFTSILFAMAGCEYVTYGPEAAPVEEDGDASTTPDGDTAEPLTGAGSFEDPFKHGADGRLAPIENNGELSGESANDGAACFEDAAQKKLRFNTRAFRKAARLLEGEESEADGDEDALEAADDETPNVDGDEDALEAADDETPNVDGDEDEEATELVEETEENEETPDNPLGLGPEVVVAIELEAGEKLSVTFSPVDDASFDGVIYILSGETCVDFFDNAAAGEAEMAEFTVTAEGEHLIVMDTKSAEATGAWEYAITLTAAGCEETTAAAEGEPGSACTNNDECVTQTCLTTEFINNTLGGDEPITLPGGYCSSFTDCAEECTNAGGMCVNGGFMGGMYSIANLCFRICQSDCDCRMDEGHICLDPQDWVDEGILDAAAKEEYLGDNAFCLPNEFAELLEGELRFQATGEGK